MMAAPSGKVRFRVVSVEALSTMMMPSGGRVWRRSPSSSCSMTAASFIVWMWANTRNRSPQLASRMH